ncbi:TonB-dependent receptor domain-containing protein [Halomonas elongata]|uniref:TonB-dependent receptor domain-containing protein n=1 Tax=Halomonas elongata TaxID=2746 RepID=UPI0023B17115|nr:TonB-dependent receptor [Halomonas elongata]
MKPCHSIAAAMAWTLPIVVSQAVADASSDSAASATTLDEMTVTGTRLPGDPSRAPLILDVIDRDDPALSTASSVEDVLSRQPGLHVAGSGRRNGQTLSLRGFDSNGVQVRLDGVRQDINTGHLGAFYIDPWLIREVQIARGALSSLYGSNAMGGVVSFETVEASDLLRSGERGGMRLSLGGATVRDELGGAFTAFGERETANGPVDGLVSVGRRESGDIRRAGGQEAPEDAELDSLLLKGGWQPDDENRLFAQWQRYDETATQPANPQQLTTEDDYRRRQVTSDNVQLGHRWRPGGASEVTSRLSLSRQEIDEDDANRTLERWGVQSDGYHRLEHGWLTQTLVFGAEADRASQRPGGGASGFPHADIDTQALYLEDTLTAGRHLSEGGVGVFDLGLGARYDRYDAEDAAGRETEETQLSPRLRLSWRPTRGLMVYSGYAEAFRAPSLSELYADQRHFAGFCPSPGFCFPDNYWVPNPDLQPETSRTWESGVAWERGDWALRASYFDTRADDFIDSEVDIAAGTTRAVNVNRARLWGFDARLAWEPEDWPEFRAFAGLSEVSGKDRDSGEALGSETPLEATLGADLDLLDRALTLGWRGRFAKAYDQPDGEGSLPGYGLHDLQLAWRVTPAFSTSLRLSNLGDKVWYRPNGALGDGRSLFASFNLQW